MPLLFFLQDWQLICLKIALGTLGNTIAGALGGAGGGTADLSY